MSNRRESRPLVTKDEDMVKDLIFKLQALLSDHLSSRSSNKRVSSSASSSSSKVLKETCNYIRKLQREVDDLSGRLSQILASREITAVDADIIKTLLKD